MGCRLWPRRAGRGDQLVIYLLSVPAVAWHLAWFDCVIGAPIVAYRLPGPRRGREHPGFGMIFSSNLQDLGPGLYEPCLPGMSFRYLEGLLAYPSPSSDTCINLHTRPYSESNPAPRVSPHGTNKARNVVSNKGHETLGDVEIYHFPVTPSLQYCPFCPSAAALLPQSVSPPSAFLQLQAAL